ncbi:LacI family DNA-binding transcriptional regulator [Bifidobacterium psychraerophilum]|uniref:Transcriptional regulator, LacI family n=1 Tax=Bifidobacterium psychraerophilum TaxID=218140 RepID=A0A087CHG4_9BIFI|nr:LacI family DNA-binding transcriptional regulator [Bifidobacterium psychraerophilum]KFI82714.1 transcriptional regulator, LacI family [Bifidobacterium psychraerophilum]PKA94462.1 LacI family transcriptional regulator [Bifidobacterium psychraerophilum DSM 22366]
MASIKDVAKDAGVSPQTVSNYFNRPSIVTASTRLKVEESVSRLGYTPNASARRLRTQRSNTIAIGIAPSGYSQIYDPLLHALVSEADAHGLRIMLYKTDSKSEEIQQFASLVAGGDVDCFILADTDHQDPRVSWLIKHHQAFVLFGRPWGHTNLHDQEVAWVDVDGKQGMADMTRHLIVTGHRRIGFLGWPDPSGTGSDRRAGWEEALVTAKLCSQEETASLREESEDNIRAGQIACTRLLRRHPDLDAIICVSDTLATGARTSLPHDHTLVITGFDNTSSAESLGFPSLEQPTRNIARELVRIAIERIKYAEDGLAPEDKQHVLLAPTVIAR